MLQPFDVGVNHPMKILLKAKWEHWIQNGTNVFIKADNMRTPDLLAITQWVNGTWRELHGPRHHR